MKHGDLNEYNKNLDNWGGEGRRSTNVLDIQDIKEKMPEGYKKKSLIGA